MTHEINLVILGAGIGLIGSFVSYYSKQIWKTITTKKSINSELKIAKYYFTVLSFDTRSRMGNLTKESLISTLNILNQYPEEDTALELTRNIKLILEQKDLDFNHLNAYSELKSGHALYLKTYRLLYLESIIGDIPFSSEKYIKQLHILLNGISIFNQLVEQSIYYYKLSFDPSIGTENYDIANEAKKST
ncbi:MAG: hypothetical protein KAH01_02630, partial [Caldisericia bacterium]|nr:hypothetical protein [Caldisericia bacterium]